MVLLLATVSVHATRYVYDDAGRVTGVVNQAGQAAAYQYDDVGNLIAVTAPTSDSVVFALEPNHGPPGTLVRVKGNALPAWPGQQIMFSAVTAALPISSDAQEIQFSVPAVTTGVHALTLEAAGNALALGSFEVTTGLGPPTIASVSHSCAKYDQVVSLTGTNFDPQPNATRVEVGGRLAKITSITESSLGFRAPILSHGGPVRVVTAAGVAQTTSMLYLVANLGDPCATITAGPEIQVDGGVVNAQLDTANTSVYYAFFAERGQWLSVQFTSPDMTTVNTNLQVRATVMAARGAKQPVAHQTQVLAEFLDLRGQAMSMHLLPIPRTGYQVLQLTSSAAVARSVGLRVTQSPSVHLGSVANLQASPGQSVRVIYDAHEGDQVGVGMQTQNSTSDNMPSSLYYYGPDHLVITPEPGSNGFCTETSLCALNLKPFEIAGEFPLMWYPQSYESVANASIRFSDDERPLLLPNQPQPIAITHIGQNARFPIQGNAGSGFSLNISGLSLTAPNSLMHLRLFAPDGTLVATKLNPSTGSTQVFPPGTMATAFQLPYTGTYTAMLDPDGGAPASAQIELDPGIPLTIDDLPLSVNASGLGRAMRFTIDATAGQKLGIGLQDIQLTPSTASETLVVSLYSPSGEAFTEATCFHKTAIQHGCELDLGPMPVSGRYVAVVKGSNTVTAATYKIQVVEDVEGALTDSVQGFSIIRPGGNARLTFAGEPGVAQTINIDAQVASPSGATVTYSVLRPDGVLLSAPLYSSGNVTGSNLAVLRIGDFPLMGTYTLFVDPQKASIANFNAWRTVGVTEGTPPTFKSVVPGPWFWSTFTSAAGGHPSVGVSIQSLSNRTDWMTIEVVDPLARRLVDYGSTQPYAYCNTYSVSYCDFDLMTAVVPGIYQVVVWPGTPRREDAQVTIAQVSDLEVTGRDGSFTLDSPGQNGRLNFDAQAGESLLLTLTRLTSSYPTAMVSFYVFDEFGQKLSSGSLSAGSNTYSLSLPNIPWTGNYSVVLDPHSGAPASVRAQLTVQ